MNIGSNPIPYHPFASPRAQRRLAYVALAAFLFYSTIVAVCAQELLSLRTVQGQVVSGFITHGRGTAHYLEFVYMSHGRLIRDSDIVREPVYAQYVVPGAKPPLGPITVFLTNAGPFEQCGLAKPEIEWILWISGFLWILALPGCLIIWWRVFYRSGSVGAGV